MSSRLKVTLRKGMIGCPPDQKGTIRALGLRRIGQSVEKNDVPEMRGMVFKVKHLVDVEEIADSDGQGKESGELEKPSP